MKLYTNDGQLANDTDKLADGPAEFIEQAAKLKEIAVRHKMPLLLFYQTHDGKGSHMWSFAHPKETPEMVARDFISLLLAWLGERLPGYVMALVKKDELDSEDKSGSVGDDS